MQICLCDQGKLDGKGELGTQVVSQILSQCAGRPATISRVQVRNNEGVAELEVDKRNQDSRREPQ